MDKEFLKGLQTSQEAEQLEAAMRQLASLVRLYHLELREQGFNAIEALTLTSQMQTAIMQNKPQGN